MPDLIDRDIVLRKINELDESVKIGCFERRVLHPLYRFVSKIPSANQWISIDEKLPEIGQDVLIHYVRKSDPSNDGITITKRVDYIWFGHTVPTEPYWKDPWQYFHSDYNITHWMSLPKKPEVIS